ncbi:MAG: anthrone oxygenase family protein [Alteriqipengyuania sp.]
MNLFRRRRGHQDHTAAISDLSILQGGLPMLQEFFEIGLVAATLATGLVAGVFLTFSDFVMRALARAAPAAGIEAMQIINREVYRSLFMTLLIGLTLVSSLLAVAGIFLAGRDVALWLVGAAGAYIVGVMAVTARKNVPMNQRLDRMEHLSTDARAYWVTYTRDWTRWNHLRWVAALAAAIGYLGATVTVAGQV